MAKNTLFCEYRGFYEIRGLPHEALDYYFKAAIITLDSRKLDSFEKFIERCRKKLELKNTLTTGALCYSDFHTNSLNKLFSARSAAFPAIFDTGLAFTLLNEMGRPCTIFVVRDNAKKLLGVANQEHSQLRESQKRSDTG